MDTLILIILIIVAILIISIIKIYNKIIRLQNRVKSTESSIDICLNQRFDLIPNLVECVKTYTKHEKGLLENIVKQRTEYSQNKNLKKASELNNTLNKIIAVLGTLFTSFSKKRELAIIVSVVNDFIRVREANEEPGSLNAT